MAVGMGALFIPELAKAAVANQTAVKAAPLKLKKDAVILFQGDSITDAGRDKRAEAQRHWKAAQLALNETLGVERVLALHALVDDSLDLLAALPAQEAGHDE